MELHLNINIRKIYDFLIELIECLHIVCGIHYI